MTSREAAEKMLNNALSLGANAELVETPITDASGNPVLGRDGKPIVQYSVVVTKMPDVEKDIYKFFTPSYVPDTPELRILRAKYDAELAHFGGRSKCRSCDQGKLTRKYVPLVRNALRKESVQNTGIKQVSRPAGGSVQGVGEHRSLLRRASAGLASLFKIGTRKGT